MMGARSRTKLAGDFKLNPQGRGRAWPAAVLSDAHLTGLQRGLDSLRWLEIFWSKVKGHTQFH